MRDALDERTEGAEEQHWRMAVGNPSMTVAEFAALTKASLLRFAIEAYSGDRGPGKWIVLHDRNRVLLIYDWRDSLSAREWIDDDMPWIQWGGYSFLNFAKLNDAAIRRRQPGDSYTLAIKSF